MTSQQSECVLHRLCNALGVCLVVLQNSKQHCIHQDTVWYRSRTTQHIDITEHSPFARQLEVVQCCQVKIRHMEHCFRGLRGPRVQVTLHFGALRHCRAAQALYYKLQVPKVSSTTVLGNSALQIPVFTPQSSRGPTI